MPQLTGTEVGMAFIRQYPHFGWCTWTPHGAKLRKPLRKKARYSTHWIRVTGVAVPPMPGRNKFTRKWGWGAYGGEIGQLAPVWQMAGVSSFSGWVGWRGWDHGMEPLIGKQYAAHGAIMASHRNSDIIFGPRASGGRGFSRRACTTGKTPLRRLGVGLIRGPEFDREKGRIGRAWFHPGAVPPGLWAIRVEPGFGADDVTVPGLRSRLRMTSRGGCGCVWRTTCTIRLESTGVRSAPDLDTGLTMVESR